MNVKYAIYPTLLDAFTSWQNSGEIWEKYWGHSECPPHTPEEFQALQRQSLIDKINRVPQEYSEAADRGTAFNLVIDWMVTGEKPAEIECSKAGGMITATYNGHDFVYPVDTAKAVAGHLAGSLAQQLAEGFIDTPYGGVRLYGYIDYITPLRVVDLKTTGSYSLGKYKGSWQRLVYPYCLQQQGCEVEGVEFYVVELGKARKDGTVPAAIYSEFYNWRQQELTEQLRHGLTDFIEFLESVRDEITDFRIFNIRKDEQNT